MRRKHHPQEGDDGVRDDHAGAEVAVFHQWLELPRQRLLCVTCLPGGRSYRREYSMRHGESPEQAVERLAPTVADLAERRLHGG
jgi:hypothetical protein